MDEAYIDGFTASNGLKLPEEKRAALRSAAQVLALLATMDAVRNEVGQRPCNTTTACRCWS
ncbi:MAG: hypothetical protein IPH00_16735 [Flavobacteriales bacterium]|nr:hypothetical protein [Flavobacteriales bacterium]